MKNILTLITLFISFNMFSQRGFEVNDDRGTNHRTWGVFNRYPSYNSVHYNKISVVNNKRKVNNESFKQIIIKIKNNPNYDNITFVQTTKTIIGYDELGKYYLSRYIVNGNEEYVVKDYGFFSIVKYNNFKYLYNKKTNMLSKYK